MDDLDVGKLKTVPIDLKKLSDVVNKEVLKTKYNTEKQDLEKKLENVENKISDVSGLATNTAFKQKSEKLEKRFLMLAD